MAMSPEVSLLETLCERIGLPVLAASAQKSTSLFDDLCVKYDLAHIAYLGINLPTKSHRNYFAQNTYSPSWALRYEAKKYETIDPLVRRAFKSLMPIDWDDLKAHNSQEVEFLGESKEFGVGKKGLSFPLHGVHGERAVFSITTEMNDADWRNFKRERLREMRILADLYHQTLVQNDNQDFKKIALSDRELECLKWSAEGKTQEDIGAILNISQTTVRFYLEGARHKLSTLNNTQTVVKALHLGLI